MPMRTDLFLYCVKIIDEKPYDTRQSDKFVDVMQFISDDKSYHSFLMVKGDISISEITYD